ncbi:MAG: primosomal protein N' [Rhodospirillaceae bacterium]|nr:primosomal protein N' [Rhodospirillaceae bacterium]
MASADRVKVLLPMPVGSGYDYRIPAGMAVSPGDFVRVPLGPRSMTGVVWGKADGAVPDDRLKSIVARHDAPPLSAAHRRFVDWIAAYTVTAPGSVLRMVMPVPEALDPPAPSTGYRLADSVPPAPGTGPRITPQRRRVIDALAGEEPVAAGRLRAQADVSAAVLAGMAKAGLIEAAPVAVGADWPAPQPARPGIRLSADQRAAVRALGPAVGGGYAAFLLDGVTGSGKTEVYFEAIAEALRQSRQSIVLLPEIALTAQWLARFEQRFGTAPAPWHSDLTRAQRRRIWRAAATGAARVVVGARSALMLPMPALGLIVVDEEHDQSFKQEDGVIYHARDMAVVRATLEKAAVVLASATPALESVANVERGRYTRLVLPERHGGAPLPAAELLDLRQEGPPRGRWLADRLVHAMAETLAAGEQALLYLNRRGYAPLTLCRGCGLRLECPQCAAWLVEHRLAGRLECHHCGHTRPLPRQCPECSAEDSFVPCGPGVERLAEEVAGLLPDARVLVATSDTVRGPAAAAALVRDVRDGAVDLLIGTQILAKGHHFPKLTLVGVVDADLGLAGGDLRAAERTWQMLNQVAGRAGRAARPGRVILQSWRPDHPVLQAITAGDRDGFIAAEKAARERYGMPPYGRLAAIVVSGRQAGAVRQAAAARGRGAPAQDGLQVLGPTPAPLALLRGHFRHRLLVKAARSVNLQDYIRRWLSRTPQPGGIRIKVDIDPYSFS